MTAAAPGDDELLRRHASGDTAAFNELVTRHRDRLWAVALRTLGNPEDAADALQDALLSAYRGAAGFRGNSAVTTWMHRIVVNACIDLARRRAARPTEPLLLDPGVEPVEHDRFTERETSLAVLAALRTLPPEQTAAIVLVDIEGYPVEEVAEILQVPAGTVKSRCARGRARLAEQLRDLDPRHAADPPRNDPHTPPVQSDAVPDNPQYGEEPV